MKNEILALCAYAARRSPLALINGVRITKTHGYATDMQVSMRYDWDGPELDVCIDAGLLSNCLSGIPDGQTLQFTPGDGFVWLKAGKRKLKLKTIPVNEMPEIELKGRPLTISAADIDESVRLVLPATATKDFARPVLMCVYLQLESGVTRLIGCDGFRVHAVTIPNSLALDQPVNALLPRALAHRLLALTKFGGELDIYHDRIVLRKGDMTFIGKLQIDNYLKLPERTWDFSGHSTKVAYSLAPLLSAIEGTIKLGMKFINVAVKDGALIISGIEAGDEFEHELDVDATGSNTDINVRPKFLLDAVSAIGPEADLAMYLSGKDLPVIIKAGNAIATIQGYRA